MLHLLMYDHTNASDVILILHFPLPVLHTTHAPRFRIAINPRIIISPRSSLQYVSIFPRAYTTIGVLLVLVMEWDDRAEAAHRSAADNWFLRYHEQRSHIAAWVSTLRGGLACELVETCCGSFNWGCHVMFEDTTEWLIRFAVPGMVMDGDAKLCREVAAMKMIGQKTTIPVPKVHSWGLSKQNPLGLGPFIVMDYVSGESLGRLWRESDANRVLRADIDEDDLCKVFRQIAGFYLELSDLKFPNSASLCIADDESIQADLCPLTLKMQEIEAHSGIRVGGKAYCSMI